MSRCQLETGGNHLSPSHCGDETRDNTNAISCPSNIHDVTDWMAVRRGGISTPGDDRKTHRTPNIGGTAIFCRERTSVWMLDLFTVLFV